MAQHEVIALSDAEESLMSTPGQMFLGEDLTIQNLDQSANVYVGGEGVSATDFGFKLIPGGAISFEVPARNKIYAISDVDGSEVAVMRLGLEDSKGR